MVDDVFGQQSGFNREDHVKMLVDILDADGDGVIEYEEWRKVAGKATSILKPAIVLQTFLQSQCFGEAFWSREKARVVPMLHKQVSSRGKDTQDTRYLVTAVAFSHNFSNSFPPSTFVNLRTTPTSCSFTERKSRKRNPMQSRRRWQPSG